MKLLIPASILLAISQFAHELREGATELVAIAQLPGMNILFSGIAFALAVGMLKVLPVLRS